VLWGLKFAHPIDLAIGLYNSLYYPTSRDVGLELEGRLTELFSYVAL